MRPIHKRPVTKMSVAQLLGEGWRIVNFFHKSSVGDPYGWDWPTMNVIHPELCARFRKLRGEFKSRGVGV